MDDNPPAVFVDTNVLVYAGARSAPLRDQALALLTGLDRSGHTLWISRQVVREYLAAITRPQDFGQRVSPAAAVA